MYRKWLSFILAGALCLWALAGCADSGDSADGGVQDIDYPTKNAEIYVPGSAGGGSDIFARMLVKVAADEGLFSKTITVVNKPGGSGSICYGYVANQPADGYTLATVSSSFFTGPATDQSPVTPADFDAVAAMAYDPSLLVVEYASPFQSLDELIAYARENPGTVNCAGSSGHSDDRILFEAVVREAGVEMNYIPFNSGSEAATAVMGGHADFGFAGPGEAMSQIEGQVMRAIAISSEERFDGMPDVPTMIEQGVDFALTQFRAVVVPKDTPEEIQRFLSDMFREIAESDAWKTDYLEANMVVGGYLSYEEADAKMDEIYAMYKDMIAQIQL